MLNQPFYDPLKSYEDNFNNGPFGDFADGKYYQNNGNPENNFIGEKVFLPFGIPAGPLLNGKFVKAALQKGFDLVIYKTVRSRQYPSHPLPNVLALSVAGDLSLDLAGRGIIASDSYNEPLSITNSFGVPSANPLVWQQDLADAVRYAKPGQVVIGSFQGTVLGDEKKYIRDFKDTARLVKETGAKVLEVNLSCPNEGAANLLCFDIKRSAEAIEAIKNEIGNLPLIAKIAYFTSPGTLRNLVKAIGKKVQGIAAINTIPARIIDSNGNQALSGEGRLISGVCGHAIKWAGLEMVKKLADLRKELDLNYSIIGVGGVMNAGDYNQYKSAGADAVMSATGAMWNPYLAQEIKQTK